MRGGRSDSQCAVFDTVVKEYAAGRPDYPDSLYGELATLLGRPLAGLTVLDVGAGTGIATRALRARDARVVGVDVAGRMLAELVAETPGVAVVRGDGNRLPFRDHSVDLVTYAQCWHWVEAAQAVPEALRVLRPGGALALWWNTTDRTSTRWLAAQERRIAAVVPGYHWYVRPDAARVLAAAPYRLRVREAEVAWSRRTTLEVHLASLRSRSYIAELGAGRADAFVAAERRALSAEFPDGVLEEPYVTYLVVAASA